MAKIPDDMLVEIECARGCNCFVRFVKDAQFTTVNSRVESDRTRVSRRCNLNFAELNTDGEPSAIRDYAIDTDDVAVHFREIEPALIREIERADYVYGCVAWLTNKRVLRALAAKQGVSLIVQKEDFLRPDIGTTASWKSDLHRLYRALPSVSRAGFNGVLGQMTVCGDLSCDAVRCVGVVADRRDIPPRSHHKFAVFCKNIFCEHGNEFWSPYAVWTGSFNWTENATRSFENAVVIRNPEIVEAFYAEFQQIAALSEPLDWSNEYVDPQWRIGT